MSSSEDERSSSQSPVKAAAKPRKAPAAARSSVSTINIVTEALEKTEEKKGLSLSGLKSFAVSNYPDLAAQAAFKSRLRKAILKGLENELLIRPAKSKECTGVTGRFKVSFSPSIITLFPPSVMFDIMTMIWKSSHRVAPCNCHVLCKK